ncbi:MAG TPA: PIG-L deacetylase family protein [Planctomycetota bacterium]
MPSALAVFAHPDDIEMLCAGTLALLKDAGWKIHLATMTAGDLGTMTLSREQISDVRRKEAAASAALLGASYACLGFEDLQLGYGPEPKRRVSALMRDVGADVVFTHAPVDYMADHEETSRIAREAAFASTIPNWIAGASTPLKAMPAVIYADPIDLTDHFGRRMPARQVVDITASMPLKEKMLACHASQKSWLQDQHGEDDYLRYMKGWCADRAKDFGRRTVKYAEGFNQHLGHAFSKADVLGDALGKKVKTRR